VKVLELSHRSDAAYAAGAQPWQVLIPRLSLELSSTLYEGRRAQFMDLFKALLEPSSTICWEQLCKIGDYSCFEGENDKQYGIQWTQNGQ
jgi:hypothetical protein